MISLLIAMAVLLLLVSLLQAPVETLGWWAGWFGEGLDEPDESYSADYQVVGQKKQPKHYIVYLDGIGKIDHENLDNVKSLLDGLSEALPDAVVLGDVMPYSVRNVGLTQDRPFSRFWRRISSYGPDGRKPLMSSSVNARNLLQVLVAADGRYGPIYGRGEAQVILTSLVRCGYDLATRPPIVIIGYSGGAQIGLVAAPFLKRALGTSITMISLGGVMASDPGLADLEHLYLLEGSDDSVLMYGRVLFPGRWRAWWGSHWNRLRRANKLTHVPMGPMKHNGAGSYLDAERFIEGRDHRSITIETMIDLVCLIPALSEPVGGPATA